MIHQSKNIKVRFIAFILFLLTLLSASGFSAISQNVKTDSIQPPVKQDELTNHSPRKATIYSAVLPGLGQIYNKKYWKVPIVYGGFATLGYFINFNNETYSTYKRAYSDIIDNNPFTNYHLELENVPAIFFKPEKLTQYTEQLRIAKDGWRRNRDFVVIGTVVFYAVNIIDASVDAHFFNFNISDDLSFNWTPAPLMCMNTKAVGFQCVINF